MQRVIGVRFKKAGKIHYFNPGQTEIEKGDTVIVETQRGLECAQVVLSPHDIADDKLKIEMIYRKANQNDLKQIMENKNREKEAFDVCQNKIAEHKLPMNLISVEYTFDMNKIIFSFTAEGRVDFRELVKDLASIFRTRIELRQVGVRDEAKLLGGIGCCGRPLCCASFLGDFVPVSIRMAKDQNLSLNPAKISGICGRLMCCLKYESDYYCEQCPREVVAIKEPKLDMRVVVDDGAGRVISINRQRRTATIILDNSQTVVAPWDNIFEAEDTSEEVKTVVAAVVEEEKVANEIEDTPEIQSEVVENKTDRFSRKFRKSQLNSTLSTQPNRSNLQSQSKFDFTLSTSQNKPSFTPPSQGRQNIQSRDNRDYREAQNRDNRSKKFQKHRRNEDYRQNRKHNSRRHDIDDND